MAYSAFAVANAFIHKALSGELLALTPMKLQRLLYFCQAWHVKGTAGKPILDDNFARWESGPVIPGIHHKLRSFNAEPISCLVPVSSATSATKLLPTIPTVDKDAWGLVEAICARYGAFTVNQLTDMVKAKGSAWSAGLVDGSAILLTEMLADPTI